MSSYAFGTLMHSRDQMAYFFRPDIRLEFFGALLFYSNSLSVHTSLGTHVHLDSGEHSVCILELIFSCCVLLERFQKKRKMFVESPPRIYHGLHSDSCNLRGFVVVMLGSSHARPDAPVQTPARLWFQTYISKIECVY